jgi:hypothetical protein
MKTHAWFLCTILTFVLVLAGCSKSATSPDMVFEKADPDTQATWQKAVSFSSTNDYAGALLMLRRLRSNPHLSPQQNEAVDNLYSKVNKATIEAFNRGDANAQAAMEMLKQLRGR